MKQILEFIWNAPVWVIVAPVCAVVGLVVYGIHRINQQRRETMNEFNQRRDEMREQMDRGARRTGTN
jgi:hypothetical protein